VSFTHDTSVELRFASALRCEIATRADAVAHGDFPEIRSFDAVYFGGGTPSAVDPVLLMGLLAECRRRFPVTEDAEITVEMNPECVDERTLRLYREGGVNRVSLGAQSLIDEELVRIGRRHTARDALRAYGVVRSAGFENISVDVMIGLPGQDARSAAHTLRGVARLNPEHVSAYMLEIKEGTKLDALVRSGAAPPPDDDLTADLYELACETLAREGYGQYEISNFCRNGMMSRHNLKYWTDVPYLGLGTSAHGMTGAARYENVGDLERYIASSLNGESPTERETPLDADTRFRDAMIMGLRLTAGVNLQELGRKFGIDARRFVDATIGDLNSAGLFTFEGDRLLLTSRGRLLSNAVFERWV
jgi:oxygen-independent coproporphyrinogen-3 oxidase